MRITPEIRHCIIQNSEKHNLNELLRQNLIPDLRQAGLEKVRQGLTSLEEVERITREF